MQKKITSDQIDIGLNDLSDVTATSPSLGDTLIYDGSNWAAVPSLLGRLIRVIDSPGDYTLQLPDATGTLIRMTGAIPTAVTIPTDSTVNFPIGANVLVSWNGIGQVFVLAALGVTIDTPDSYNIGRQYGKITIIKTAANRWEIEGNLEPV
jgi:hypothetical protein